MKKKYITPFIFVESIEAENDMLTNSQRDSQTGTAGSETNQTVNGPTTGGQGQGNGDGETGDDAMGAKGTWGNFDWE